MSPRWITWKCLHDDPTSLEPGPVERALRKTTAMISNRVGSSGPCLAATDPALACCAEDVPVGDAGADALVKIA